MDGICQGKVPQGPRRPTAVSESGEVRAVSGGRRQGPGEFDVPGQEWMEVRRNLVVE
jgi:hypothetical protein